MSAEERATYDRFEMLYCDNGRCRVNTFERGRGAGKCPGCGAQGIEIHR